MEEEEEADEHEKGREREAGGVDDREGGGKAEKGPHETHTRPKKEEEEEEKKKKSFVGRATWKVKRPRSMAGLATRVQVASDARQRHPAANVRTCNLHPRPPPTGLILLSRVIWPPRSSDWWLFFLIHHVDHVSFSSTFATFSLSSVIGEPVIIKQRQLIDRKSHLRGREKKLLLLFDWNVGRRAAAATK